MDDPFSYIIKLNVDFVKYVYKIWYQGNLRKCNNAKAKDISIDVYSDLRSFILPFATVV